MPRLGTLLDATADGQLGQEASDEGIPCTIGVDQKILGEEGHGVFAHHAAARDEGGVLALRGGA